MYVPPKPVEFLFQEQQFCVFKMQTPPKMKVLLAKKAVQTYTTVLILCDLFLLHVNILMLHIDINNSHVNIIIFHADIIDLACIRGRGSKPNAVIRNGSKCQLFEGALPLYKYR